MILCDTDVLIEFYKGNQSTVEQLQSIGLNSIAVSAVTKAELLYGARDRKEFDLIDSHLNQCRCLHIIGDISVLFIELMRRYALSHKPKIPDLLIAATAIIHDAEIFTMNTKDFRFIDNLRLYSPA